YRGSQQKGSTRIPLKEVILGVKLKALKPTLAERLLPISGCVVLLPLIAFLMLVPTSQPRATMVQRVTLPELVRRSETIVHGVVESVRTEPEAGGARIYTYITLSGREFLKGGGAPGTQVTFRQLGGQVGDQVLYVAGTPRFHPKEEILVFLTGKDGGGF